MRKIIFITGNKNKVKEANYILSKLGIIVKQKNCGYPEIRDNNIENIALYGAMYAAENLNCEVMVDDTGIFIDALNGFPGQYSAYVLKTLGIEKILKLMENETNRKATFKCAIGYSRPNDTPRVFSGEVVGTITKEIKGNFGFGYDPIFQIGKYSFGEMNESEKNKISHRYKALVKFAQWLSKTERI